MKPALRPLTATLLSALAAALPLQAQSPPPAHPDTWPPHFVSLTHDLLYEVEPSDYIADPATLDGAQLFYAPVQGDDPVATLQEAAVLLVRPYNIVERQEAPLREWECVWGTLDHLYLDKVPQFWRRPSTAFYSCTHPTLPPEKAGDRPKVQIDFTQWWSSMPVWVQRTCTGFTGEKTLTLSPADKLRTTIQYINTLQTSAPDGNTAKNLQTQSINLLIYSYLLDKWMPDAYPAQRSAIMKAMKTNTVQNFRDLSEKNLWESMLNHYLAGCGPEPGKASDTVRSTWADREWAAHANLERTSPLLFWWLADWSLFQQRQEAFKQLPGQIAWEQEFAKTLNETAGKYDGLLYLKDADRIVKDFPKTHIVPQEIQNIKVPLSIDSPGATGTVEFSSTKFYATILRHAGITTTPPRPSPPTPPEVRLIPFVAKVHQKGTEETDQTTALAKAVILSDGLATRQDGDFVILAIACDWKDKSSASDGITVTKTYQSNSTLEQDLLQRVDRAEYSRIARSNYTFRTDPQTQEASYTWQGPSSGVRLEENALQSPAAFRAGASGLKYRLLVAVREDIDGKWTLMAEPEPMNPITSDEGTYYAYTRENLAQTVRQTGCRSLAKSITFASPEKPGRYFLYEVDVQQDYSLTPCIRYGNMKHLWVLRKGAYRKYTDHTDMTEIYTIFGDSTWPKSGVIAEKPSPYNNTVLVWEDALKALTIRFTGDVARERTIDTQYQKGRCYQPTENGKADHSDILALLAYGQQLFTSQNERALGGSFHNAIYMQFVINEEWTELASCDFRLSSLLSDINNAYSADVVCSESSGCLSVLPRLCGYHQIIEMIAAKSLASSSANHGYNVCHSKQYDAYPPNRKEGEPDPPRTRINSLFKKGQLYDFNFTIYEKSLDIKFINLN